MSDIFHPIASDSLFDDMEIRCVLDGYEPRLAHIVVETISEIRDERIFSVMFGVWIDGAREGLSLN